MLKTYELSCNIDIMGNPRVTLSKGRYTTGDKKVQRILGGYPGVTLISTEAEPARAPLTPEAALALHGPAPGQPEVTSVVGLQMKIKSASTSARVAEG